MSHSLGRWFSAVLTSLLSLAAGSAGAQDSAADAAESSALGFERTPPRLSFTDGEVSYWRPGAADWTAARLNTPLAVGDEVSTGAGANLELQIGSRAYVRAGEATQLGLATLEPDYIELRLTSGTASLDLRELAAGQTLEIGTPNAAFTIERKGYYRVEVADGATKFISRRGGRASVTTAGGLPASIGAGEQIVVTGTEAPVVATYGAPELDDWDRWNYGRSDEQIAAVSSRYVPEGVYGANDLDDHGSWRVVPSYGAVWVPRVVVGWTPYSAGTWVADPYYGWTWVDDAPWGWAPFHYGRWVYVGSGWAWSPGPRVVRPYYAPALVAFYGSPSVSVSVNIGVPSFGWVALGWGEPVVPWWGPRGCHGVPRWSGWGGPRVVNNVVIKNKTTINVNNIYNYQNANHRGALVAVDRNRFGRGNVREARLARFDAAKLRPLNRGELGVGRERSSRSASEARGARGARAAGEARDRRVSSARESSGSGLQERTRSPRGESRRAGANGTESAGARARGASRIDARPARIAPPPVRVARADTSARRNSASSRPTAARNRPRESVAQEPQRASAAARRPRANERAARRESATTARPPAPTRSSPRREAPNSSVRTPRSQSPAARSPRAERAPREPRERANPSPRGGDPRQRASSREPARQPSREPAIGAQRRIDRAERRGPAAEPRPSPAPSQSTPRSRGREGNDRRRDEGPRSRRG